YVSPDFLELQRDVISERAFRIEYEAAFLDSVGRVFRTEAIAACVVPALPAPPPDGPVCIGVDWGRSNDYTAVVVLQGTREGVHVLDVDRFTDEAWDAQLSRVRGILRRYPRALVSCDATGLGQPISEMLQQDPAGTRVFQVPFTEKVKESLVGNLAWAIENRRIKMLPQPDLIRELQHFEMTSGGRGAKYGAASGFHDDLVIALALAVSKIPHAYRPAIHRGQERRLA
ncbi:MAG TPA: hypothetical protein VEX38_07585, partial [Fimbriimonadaceae bacterium]|nr:hypothetical protein [Fimbriimonadaceae bacterium]